MDIDAPEPAGHYHLTVPSFSVSFPLPYRVLFLIVLGVTLWALNLHVLHLLGIDTSWILGIRRGGRALTHNHSQSGGGSPHVALAVSSGEDESSEDELSAGVGQVGPGGGYAKARDVYGAVYGLVGVLVGWCLFGWVMFRWLSGGEEEEEMDRWRALPFLTAAGLVMGVWMPYAGVWKRERVAFVQSLRRCLTSPIGQPILFCDVITADIFTSFAKVIGDLWVSSCLVFGGHISASQLEGAGSGMGYWVVPLMTSIPYFVRLRQCIVEYATSDYQNTRPLLNALKYASAFPVILLSAVQKVVVADVAADRGVKDLGESTWFGEHPLFRLWLLSVFINSFYSFWWDVTNDWGLTILSPSEWETKKPTPYNPHTSSFPRSGPRGQHHKRTQSILNRAFSKFITPGPKPTTPNTSSTVDFVWTPHHARISSHSRSDPPSPNRYVDSSNGGDQQSGVSHHTTNNNNNSSSASVVTNHSVFPPIPTTTSNPIHSSSSHSRSNSITPNPSHSHSQHNHHRPSLAPQPGSYPFGLRPTLHFPDPSVYYLAIAIDLILRFTWSLKLSSHLHTISEIESGVFLMEALELGRRWMWVFLRVEWEGIRKAELLAASSSASQHSDPTASRRRLAGHLGGDDDEAEEILLMGMGSGLNGDLTGRDLDGKR